MAIISGGQVFNISTGQTDNGLLIIRGGVAYVMAGGKTIGSTLAGGHQTVRSGGSASGSRVFGGGTETVSSGGAASGSIIGGGNTGWPVTQLHLAANANEAFGSYNAVGDPGSVGFNLADITSTAEADELPPGVKGLIWLNNTSGLTADFINTINAAANDPKVYGFYVADEPPDSAIPNLALEDAYIAQHAPGKISLIVAVNDSSPQNPFYAITPANTGADLIGLDPYPVRPEFPGGIDLSVIDDSVNAALSRGWSRSQIVPVYQAFGGGSYASWAMPTASQARQMLAEWGKMVPHPAFDYTYSWGAQGGDTALVDVPAVQAVFAQHNERNAGSQYVYGTARAATINAGGRQLVEGGGTAIGTNVRRGGVEWVLRGGTLSAARVGIGGKLSVAAGGDAFGTVVNGGRQNVFASGSAAQTVVNNRGYDRVFGTDRGTTVNSGGFELVFSGGTATGTTVRSGGHATIFSHAAASGLNVQAGGVAVVSSGGVANATRISGGTVEIARGGSIGIAPVTFAGGGTLQLDAAAAFTGRISGFTVPDRLDLRDIAFVSGTTGARFVQSSPASGTLTVTDGRHTANLTLLGQYQTSQFNLGADGHGGTLVTDPPPTLSPSQTAGPEPALLGFAEVAAVSPANPTGWGAGGGTSGWGTSGEWPRPERFGGGHAGLVQAVPMATGLSDHDGSVHPPPLST